MAFKQDWLYFNIFQKESSIFLTFSISEQISNTINNQCLQIPVDSLYLLHIQLELFCVLRGNNWVPKLNGPLSVVLKNRSAFRSGQSLDGKFDKCFFSDKKSSRGLPAFCCFQRFFQCSGNLNQRFRIQAQKVGIRI
jgi:hypothetical protein